MNHNNLKLFSKNNYKNYNIYAITKKLKVFIILFFYNIFLSTLVLANDEAISLPTEQFTEFAKAYAISKKYYVDNVDDTKVLGGAINGMLSSLDPHSSYLDSNALKQLNETITYGAFAGIGIEISRETGNLIKVIAPIDSTPAYFAGIKSGDIIIKIDNTPTNSLSLEEAVKRMRGTVGSKVKLTISREKVLKPLEFNIVRANIKIQSVKYNLIDNKYLYIRITNFQTDTTTRLLEILNNVLNKQQANKKSLIQGIILDLRDNPGGLLQSAIGVSGIFLPENAKIVSVSGKLENSNAIYYNKLNNYSSNGIITSDYGLLKANSLTKNLALLVLINQGSASASEIVVAALQDYSRAIIVGNKSFGKGSVQTLIPLSDNTAIKLTTALYYTPNNRSIQAQGIIPDIVIHNEYDDLVDSWNIAESSLEQHLNNPNKNLANINDALLKLKHDILTNYNVDDLLKIKDTKSKINKNNNLIVIAPQKQLTNIDEVNLRAKNLLKSSPKVVNQNLAFIDLNNDFQLNWAIKILNLKKQQSIPENNNR